MRTEYKHNPPIPYSLHDMRVKKIIIQDKTIVLEFDRRFSSNGHFNLLYGQNYLRYKRVTNSSL